ncbi:MAG: hypothetical protein WD426_01085 [Anditalea sp.]
MLVVNDPQFAERAEIIWEKGTNPAAFSRGKVNLYNWDRYRFFLFTLGDYCRLSFCPTGKSGPHTAEKKGNLEGYLQRFASIFGTGTTGLQIPKDPKENIIYKLVTGLIPEGAYELGV